MPSTRVTRISANQWPILKDVRLRALKEAPYAFGTTFAEGQERTDAYWREMAKDHATRPDQAYFMAYANENACGMAGCYHTEGDTAVLTSMWVAPEVRGQKIGEQIIQAVTQWAQEAGATILDASVSENNPAQKFYQKLGFEETGETEPLRSNPKIQILMIRRNITPKNPG